MAEMVYYCKLLLYALVKGEELYKPGVLRPNTLCVCVYTCLCLLGISPANDLNSLKLLMVMWVTLATTARHGHAFAGSLMPFSRLTQELFLQLVVSHGGETKTKTDILHISKALS